MLAKGTIIRMICAAVAFVQSDACAQRASAVATPRAPMPVVGDSSLAVRQFVRGFYDWYTPVALSFPRFPAWYNVLNNANRYLDRDLAAALREDSVAREADPIPRETLNYDPFLDSQDPCGPNEVVDVLRQGSTFRVPIRQCHSKLAGPVVEVRPIEGSWRITNVFSERSDLKSWLCKWAKADVRPERRPAKCP